jgi:peptidoglycan/LPS O-acetylase OafA/YrhL
MRYKQSMTIPAGMTDLFPAFALGGVALMGLMARIEPPSAVRWSVVGILTLLLVLYLSDQLHMWLPDNIGLPLYGALLAVAGAIILWNRHMARASRRH